MVNIRNRALSYGVTNPWSLIRTFCYRRGKSCALNQTKAEGQLTNFQAGDNDATILHMEKQNAEKYFRRRHRSQSQMREKNDSPTFDMQIERWWDK